jgi:hypothetical protein
VISVVRLATAVGMSNRPCGERDDPSGPKAFPQAFDFAVSKRLFVRFGVQESPQVPRADITNQQVTHVQLLDNAFHSLTYKMRWPLKPSLKYAIYLRLSCWLLALSFNRARDSILRAQSSGLE